MKKKATEKKGFFACTFEASAHTSISQARIAPLTRLWPPVASHKSCPSKASQARCCVASGQATAGALHAAALLQGALSSRARRLWRLEEEPLPASMAPPCQPLCIIISLEHPPQLALCQLRQLCQEPGHGAEQALQGASSEGALAAPPLWRGLPGWSCELLTTHCSLFAWSCK